MSGTIILLQTAPVDVASIRAGSTGFIVDTTGKPYVKQSDGSIGYLAQVPSSPTTDNLASYSSSGNLQDSGIPQSAITRCLYSQTSTVTIANTTSALSLFSSGSGSLSIPSALCVAGNVLMVDGFISIASTGSPTTRFKFIKGSTTILDTGAVAVTAGSLAQVKVLMTFLSPTSVAASGLLRTQVGNATPITVSSATETLDLTFQWGTADPANTISAINLVVKVFKGG